jgi:hypothetical protein
MSAFAYLSRAFDSVEGFFGQLSDRQMIAGSPDLQRSMRIPSQYDCEFLIWLVKKNTSKIMCGLENSL